MVRPHLGSPRIERFNLKHRRRTREMRPEDSAAGCKLAVPCHHGNMDEDLDLLCARIGGLKKLSDGHWIAPSQAHISYPPASHTTMSEVEASSFWFGHRNQVIVSAVSRFPPQGPLLDVGGGNGFVSLGLRKAGFSAIVVEPGPSGAQTSRKRGLPVIEAAFETLAIPDGSLSAVGMFDVLEHVEKDDATLRSLHAALRSGGKLYLAVPALAALWSGADRDGGHYRRYTQAGLSRQLRQAGFRVRYGTYFFGPLVLPLLLLKALPYRLGLGRAVTAASITAEHHLPGNWLGRVFDRLLLWERRRIGAGRRMGIGTSLILVAEKL